MTERSPLLIKIMLACILPDAHKQIAQAQWESSGATLARGWLADNDLIDGECRITERGRAWVRAICDTPLPIATWSLPARPPVTVEQEAAE